MLELKGFTKKYGEGKFAVKNLNLKVENGDIVAFIGHNGAGKSTTIKSIVGILDFEEGDILIDGKSIKSNPLECKSIMAYVPDNPDIYEHLTGIQYLNFICDIYRINKTERIKLIEKYAELFEVKNSIGNLISSYSHGMKQKIVLIGALIHSPKLLILDEPFVGLDPKAAYTLKKLMKEFCEQGNSIFFSTHVLEVAEKICNKIAIIKDGVLVKSGYTKDITKDCNLENIFMELIEDGNN